MTSKPSLPKAFNCGVMHSGVLASLVIRTSSNQALPGAKKFSARQTFSVPAVGTGTW